MKNVGIGAALLYITLVAGWITNIVNVIGKLVGDTPLGELGSMIILEVIGIPFGPLGVVLGIVSWF